jgi:membrane fusion protein (multidrug efflux system)
MSKRLIITIVLVAIAVAVAGRWYGQNSQQHAVAPAGPPPAVIAATEVAQESWQPSLQAVGSLVATNGINLTTEVNGIISQLLFQSGQLVEQGQAMVKLNDSVDVAALEALRAERTLAEVQFKRTSELLEKRITSKSEHDEAQARYEASSARVKQQEAIIGRKVIRAPFAGLAGIRRVDLGQYIEAGETIVGLQALDTIYADYTLPERYLSRVKPGQVVNVRLDAIPGRVFSGEVSAVDSGIDTGTRTLKVRATLANPEGVMRPGMFAQVETITGEAQPVLTLPGTAISFNTYGNFVFVINKDEKGLLTVKHTPVETGEMRSGRVVVSNLPAGTAVVRAGMIKLRDGVPVKIDNQVELKDAEISGQ